MNMFPCPTSSATKAQVWFELRSGGLRVMAHGLALAALIYFLFAMGIPYVFFRPFAMIAVFGAIFASMLLYGRNAFGIRRAQKRAYLSAFEATQPCGTAKMASVKLLVRTACMIVALATIGVSSWVSISLVNEWAPWISEKGKTINLPLLEARSGLARELFEELTAYQFAAQMVTTLVIVFAAIAVLAAFTALWARYPRRVLITGLLLFLCGFALQLGAQSLPPAIRTSIHWIIAAAMLVTIISLLRSGFAERALTITYVCGAIAISVANFVACLATNLPPISVGEVTRQMLLPLMICVLAPWALSRIRHT